MTQNTDYLAPDWLRTRGTVIVVPGRGETPASYARLGSRLAYDAYRVKVTELPRTDPSAVAAFLGELDCALSAAVAGLAAETADGLVRPLVVAGADLGAAGLSALLARADPSVSWWPQGLVLAGLPGYAAAAAADWPDELDLRTHCPTHRNVLTCDNTVQRGRLADAAPAELLDAAYESTVDVPQLLLVGDADSLADRGALARAAKALPAARLAVVRGGHHDVLNDLQHRSVAAEIVTFLEAVRSDLVPAIDVAVSTW
jgi:alpha-beta hydrolase superfamily lysophospholipase